MILYKKAPSLRIVRAAVPEPPFWAATTIAPYTGRRGAPVAIDYAALTASAPKRMEVDVCDDVEREWREPREPLVIDASESAEIVYRRGDDVLRRAEGATFLTSTRGALPSSDKATVVIAAWPLDFVRLQRLFDEARTRKLTWGVGVPVMYPVTTAADALERLAAAAGGTQFFAALPIETDATARKALADDPEAYELLFHGDVEALHVTAERRIAGLAAEIGAADFIVPPRWEQRSNWNGAALLTLAASRMLAMKNDVETASRIARSARVVAQLDKPLARIAAAAHLSIVESLDEISVDALTEWLETGKSTFVDHINKQWRL
ncbi:MAG TPA: hypothetical protein VG323_01525 [Thermoanaerobaculia bacterium]|nr:hypothetical protein [Thermoanaerobaculia bacterium]